MKPTVQRTFLGFVRCADGFSIRLDGPQHNVLLLDLSIVLMGSFGLNLAGPLCQEVCCADVHCGECLLYICTELGVQIKMIVHFLKKINSCPKQKYWNE